MTLTAAAVLVLAWAKYGVFPTKLDCLLQKHTDSFESIQDCVHSFPNFINMNFDVILLLLSHAEVPDCVNFSRRMKVINLPKHPRHVYRPLSALS